MSKALSVQTPTHCCVESPLRGGAGSREAGALPEAGDE